MATTTLYGVYRNWLEWNGYYYRPRRKRVWWTWDSGHACRRASELDEGRATEDHPPNCNPNFGIWYTVRKIGAIGASDD